MCEIFEELINLSGSGVLEINQPLLFSNTHDFFDDDLGNIKRYGIYVSSQYKAIKVSIIVLFVDEKGYNYRKLPKGGLLELKIFAKNILNDKSCPVVIYKNYIEVLSNVIDPICPIDICEHFYHHSVIYGSIEYTNSCITHPINLIIKAQLVVEEIYNCDPK